jgi:broad specificity phosphatase PhoE
MNFYIFRHAMTYFSKNDVPYGDQVESAEILPEGIPIVKKLALYLKNIKTDVNFSSPYKRCRQTVEIVKEITGKDFTFDERLHDYNPRNENIEEMFKRLTGLYGILKEKNYKNVAICTHGFPIATLIALMTKGKVDESDLENYPDTGILVIVKDKKVEYLDFN